MRNYGLIGYPLAHSFSKKYFAEKFRALRRTDCAYNNYELSSISGLPEIIRKDPCLLGLNVTRPYKESVFNLLNGTDPVAAATRAVNTIRITRSENQIRLLGYNTDAYGFETSLAPFLDSRHKKALVLGTGATSRTVAYVLGKTGIECGFVSRTGTSGMTYTQLDERILSEFSVIVNTTPVGTWPDVQQSPDIPYQHLTAKHLLFDMVYNPEESLFLQKGKAQGSVTLNGYQMLTSQADKAWEIWNEDTL